MKNAGVVVVLVILCCVSNRVLAQKEAWFGDRLTVGAAGGLTSVSTAEGYFNVIRLRPIAGISMQFHPQKLPNTFGLVDIAMIVRGEHDHPFFPTRSRFTFSVYGGAYIGKGNIRGMAFTGVSRFNGSLDTGVGLSYKRKLSLMVSVGLLELSRYNHFGTIQLRYHPRFKTISGKE